MAAVQLHSTASVFLRGVYGWRVAARGFAAASRGPRPGGAPRWAAPARVRPAAAFQPWDRAPKTGGSGGGYADRRAPGPPRERRGGGDNFEGGGGGGGGGGGAYGGGGPGGPARRARPVDTTQRPMRELFPPQQRERQDRPPADAGAASFGGEWRPPREDRGPRAPPREFPRGGQGGGRGGGRGAGGGTRGPPRGAPPSRGFLAVEDAPPMDLGLADAPEGGGYAFDEGDLAAFGKQPAPAPRGPRADREGGGGDRGGDRAPRAYGGGGGRGTPFGGRGAPRGGRGGASYGSREGGGYGGGRGGGRGGGYDPTRAAEAAIRGDEDEDGDPSVDPEEGSILAEIGASRPGGDVPRVILKRGKARLFKEGNPMIYTGAVDRIEARPGPVTGDPVIVTDGGGHPIGWGTFNPSSLYRVRMLQREAEARKRPELVLDVPALLAARLDEAVALRKSLGLPQPGVTTALRLVNSEGDRLSGLVVDCFGHVAVVQCSAAWILLNKQAITDRLMSHTGFITEVIWRNAEAMLQLEGITPQGVPVAAPAAGGIGGEEAAAAAAEAAAAEEEGEGEGGEPAAKAPRAPDRTIDVLEDGVKFTVALVSGQKTGFYCDQRTNRALVRALAAAASGGGASSWKVADLCCYSGGFAVSAALGGAGDVVGVDSSEAALVLARANAAANGVEGRVRFVRADVESWVREQAAAGEAGTYDFVVLDPPKLAPNRGALDRATPKYKRMNRAAMALLKPGGLLLTCSCSGAMTQSGEFPLVVRSAAEAAGRELRLLRTTGAAADHSQDVAFPEGAYLTALLAAVQ